MSKFFGEGNNSDSSEEEVEEVHQVKKNKFDVEDDYVDNDKDRVILTEKQKKTAVFKKFSDTIITAINNLDFDRAWDNLEKMLREVEKSAKYIEREGYPPAVLRAISFANEEIMKVDPETKKKMKNPKSFNIMKQKLKNKIMPEYEVFLKDFVDVNENEEKSSDSDEILQSASSDNESEEEKKFKQFLKSTDPMVRRKYWYKRAKKEKEEESSDSESVKSESKNKKKNDKERFHLREVQKKEQIRIATAKEAEVRIRTILKEFAKLSVQEKREEYLDNLDAIVAESKKYRDFERLSILLVDIPIRIEVNRQMRITHFSRESWLKLFDNVKSIFSLLRESEDEELLGKIARFEQNSEEALLGLSEKEIYELLKTFVINLDRELHKSFDFLENNEPEYSDRMQDLIQFVDFMYKLSRDMIFKDKEVGLERSAADVCFKVLENMYFMSTTFMEKVKESCKDVTFTELADEDQLEELGKLILALENSQYTTKTLLYLVYNHAINRRNKAKDLLSMTNIADVINSKDYLTQAYFNRAMVQLGISAFHQGNLYETQQILSDICGMGKNKDQSKDFIREYLAQPQRTDKDAPRHRILPYYLHLNIEMIEAIELIASMVLEVPYTLTEGSRISSKTFKRLFYEYERSHFIAEPLKYRDLVYAASNQLKLGNWKGCFEHLLDIKIWNELGEEEQANLKANVKETALKCYILANRKCFRCISLAGLAEKFELDLKTVKKLVCKWINQKEREKDFIGTITDDDYLNLVDKRRDRETGIKKICEKLFVKLEDISSTHEQLFRQGLGANLEQEEEEADPEARVVRKVNQAITDKLKNILSRRA